MPFQNIMCQHFGCGRHASYGRKGTKEKEYCAYHGNMKVGYEDNRHVRCYEPSCNVLASFRAPGTTGVIACKNHRKPGYVSNAPRCIKCKKGRRTHNFPGKKPKYCNKCKVQGQIALTEKMCIHSDCTKQASFGSPVEKKRLYCINHCTKGVHVNLKRLKK